MWWITNAQRERCMLTLAYNRKLADPPAAQPVRFIHAFPCIPIHQHFVLFSFLFFLIPPVSFHFFPFFMFSPLLPLYLSIIIFRYQERGVQKGKKTFLRSLLSLTSPPKCERLMVRVPYCLPVDCRMAGSLMMEKKK